MSNMQLYVIAVVQHHRFVANRFGLKFCFVVVFYYNKSMLCIIINNYRCVCVRERVYVCRVDRNLKTCVLPPANPESPH